MATLADELLNDFEDSGSEGDGEQQNGFLHDAPSPPLTDFTNGHSQKMALDEDEDSENDDEDVEMVSVAADGQALPGIDEEEAKAKVEKMQLGGVSDVRNVAGLMKTLEPVLEVSLSKSTLWEAQGLHLSHTQS